MTYTLDLKSVGIVVGLLLIIAHLIALLQPKLVQTWLTRLPRSRFWGVALMATATLWGWLLIQSLDMGEFTNFKKPLLILVPVAFFLSIRFVDELLAVRALGILCLLAAEPILCAAFMKPQVSRLLLVVLAYVWIVVGMFWIGMPYLLRDQVAWLVASLNRWRAAVVAGLVYGAAILVFAFTQY